MITLQLQGDWDYLQRASVAFTDFIRRAPKVAAEQYTEMVFDWIHAGKAFHKRTGQLEQSINWRPEGNDAIIRAGSATAFYATYVEFGTGTFIGRSSWPIVPVNRKALKIPAKGGGFIYRKKVQHLGSRPFPFFFADYDNRLERMRNALWDDFNEALK